MTSTTSITTDRAPAQRQVVVGLVTALGAAVVWFARAPFALNGLWAEDGRNWLQDAVEVGGIEAFGRADAGYYHFLPRVAGAVAGWLPIDQAAVVMWSVSALVVAWFAFTTFTASRTWIESVSARAILSIALVALPVHREESIGNVANLHFVMLFVGLVVLLSRPERAWETWNGAVLLVMLGLSTPIALALVPFAVWRVLRDRRFTFDALACAWGLGIVGQIVPILVVRPDRPGVEGATLIGSGSRLLTDVVAQNFFPLDRAAQAVGLVLAIGMAVLVLVAARRAWRVGDRERAVLLVGVPATGVVLQTISSIGFGARPRYALFPALCLLWALLVAVETIWNDAADTSTRRTALAVLGVVLVAALLPQWTATDYRRSVPDWQPALDAATERCATSGATAVGIVIGPTDLPPNRQWTVRVPCDELLGSGPGA